MKLFIIFVAMSFLIIPGSTSLFGLDDTDVIVSPVNLQEGLNINLDPNTITMFGRIATVLDPIFQNITSPFANATVFMFLPDGSAGIMLDPK